ncbi:MAG: hypothetical protein LBC70_03640 [Chitinispirillales bacterium]|jgi:hypothetical protein|nr:hypothetical protein [Chitinispirillales bacterium]
MIYDSNYDPTTDPNYEDDPSIDYEYYDTTDFGDKFREARERGELYTFAQLKAEYGCADAHEAIVKARELNRAKRLLNAEPATCLKIEPAGTRRRVKDRVTALT